MKRYWLTILAVLIGFTASASDFPALYLRGSFSGTNWEAREDFKFVKTGENHYELNVASLDGMFKISNSDWTINLGAPNNSATEVELTGACNMTGIQNGYNFSASNLKNAHIYFDLNMAGDKAAETIIKFDVDGIKAPSIPVVNGQQPTGTLPVIYITTANNEEITSKDKYLKGTYYLDPMGIDGVEAFGSAEAPLALQIKGSGNYIWTAFEKKPYRLKLKKKFA